MAIAANPTGRTARLAAVATVAVLVAASAWLLAEPERAESRVPTDAAQNAAATRVAEGFRDGDVVRVHPGWFTGPRRGLAERLPDAVFPWWNLDLRGHVDPLHLLRYRRLWVIAAFEDLDDDDPTTIGLPLGSIDRWDGERVRVSLYDLPPSPIRYDLLRRLGDAEVRRGARRCRWDAAALRHRCGEQTWKDVAVAVKEVGDATRQVVYAEPHPANTDLTITYPGVPMEGTLLLHTGFSIEGARRTSGADARVQVLVDGTVVADWVEPKNEFVWRATTLAGDGGSHAVTIRVSAPDVGWRQLCYDGAVVSAEGARLLGLP